jgi:hypothetical protein
MVEQGDHVEITNPDDEDAEVDDSQVTNQGNRENLVNTTSRVCFRDYEEGSIEIDNDYNEVLCIYFLFYLKLSLEYIY